MQQLLPGQEAAPTIDTPFLSCPLALTVAGLKKLLLLQLQQQGTTAHVKSGFDVQLLQPPASALGPWVVAGTAAGGGSGGNSSSSTAVLADDLTVGQLHERSGGLGPDVQLQYRLVGV